MKKKTKPKAEKVLPVIPFTIIATGRNKPQADKPKAGPSSLPWWVGDVGGQILICSGKQETYRILAWVRERFPAEARAIAKEVAALIVRAVNAHDALIGRLKDRMDSCGMKSCHGISCQECDSDRAALRAAGEEV